MNTDEFCNPGPNASYCPGCGHDWFYGVGHPVIPENGIALASDCVYERVCSKCGSVLEKVPGYVKENESCKQ